MSERIECSEAREGFGALLDDELEAGRREALEAHLAECSDCLRDLDSLQRTDRLYQRLERRTAPAGFEEDIQNVLHPSYSRATLGRRSPWLLLAAAVLVVIAATLFSWLLRQPNRFQTASAPVAESVEADRDSWMPSSGAFRSERVEDEGAGLQPRTVGAPPEFDRAQEAVRAEPQVSSQADLHALGFMASRLPSFEYRDGVWVQSGYDGQPFTVIREGAEFEALQIDASLAERITSRRPPIIFEHDGVWRRLEEPEAASGATPSDG